MTTATIAQTSIDLRTIAERLAPGRFRFDPLGVVSGYKAYQIYTGLSAKSDQDLARLGVRRTDLPRIAIAAVENLRTA